MKQKQLKIRFSGPGAFVRGVAVFFLIFAFADLAFPQIFCREELGGLPNARAASDAKSYDALRVREESAAAAPTSDDGGSRPYEPSREAPQEEDCFCCCAHLLAGVNFRPNVPGALKLSFDPYPDSVPTPPLRGTDHPPRTA